MVSFILLLIKEFKIYELKSTKNLIFLFIILNVDSSLDIKDRQLKFSVVVIGIIMDRRELCLRFCIKALVFVLCDLENDVYKIYKMFPDFYKKNKN